MSVEFFQKGRVLQFESLIYNGTPGQPLPPNPNPINQPSTNSIGLKAEAKEPASSAFKEATEEGKIQSEAKQVTYVPPRQSALFKPKHGGYS